MYRYYALSDVCYVYLSDVPADCDMTDHGSEFSESQWHKRGWTLQELLAPKTVMFMSSTWTLLGMKLELAQTLEEITGVGASVLRFDEDVTDVSVAARMSWASTRTTTRVEDEAYCLFGIFGINLPALYGEGRNAFYRLQEEIMRTSVDTSLFAWGHRDVVDDPEEIVHSHCSCSEATLGHLLAPSLAEFSRAKDISSPGIDDEVLDGRVGCLPYRIHFST